MKKVDYKYEIAFSFLKKDELLANQIKDLLQNGLKPFLYSKSQETEAGTDLEIKFMNVFGKQSRSVVVLFRDKWGTTQWTQIEEKAIRDRAKKEGYDFLLFIILDSSNKIPKYLPKTQIWEGLTQLGINGAVNIIEERVKSLKGDLMEEFSFDVDVKINTDPTFEVERSKFLESVSGLEIAAVELKKLFSELEKAKNKIEGSKEGTSFDYQQKDRSCRVKYGKYSVRFYSQLANNNQPMDSSLYFELQKQGSSSNEPNILAVEEYHFEIKKPGVYGWIKDVDNDSFISSKKLAEDSINLLISQVDDE